MPETNTVDEVVSERPSTQIGGALRARPVAHETVDAGTGTTKVTKNGAEEDAISEGARKGRVYKESTVKLLEQLESEEAAARAPAAHEMGDADEDEPTADADAGDDEGESTVDAASAGEGDVGDGGEVAAGAGAAPAPKPDPAAEWQTKAQSLEQRNREILAELEAARATPKSQRTERETALVDAESAYVEEGTIPAIRKFIGVIVGAAPDSKEVDAELSGLFTDLTARELGVPLDQNQQALRDNARTRLLLARDKREKADGAKKAEPGDGAAEAMNYEAAVNYVDNMLVTKGQSGTSLADEYPMLMTLSEDFDGFKPGEVLARAIRQEIMVGTLDPRTNEVDMIRAVAPKIEKHYDAVAKKIEAARAKKTKPDTTPSVTPKVAPATSKEQRQSTEARTITNATASHAPAKLPKATAVKSKTTSAKSRKDFPSEAAWKEHLLSKHFPG